MAPPTQRIAGNGPASDRILSRPSGLTLPSRMGREPSAGAPAPVRRYDVQSLDENGHLEVANRIAPAVDAFEATSGAFAHGTLIDTPDGPVAVEDMTPGMFVTTRDRGAQPLLWIGSMTLVPQTAGAPVRTTPARLTRITADSIGLGRPARDLVLGPYARILRRNAACLPMFGTEAAFAPARALTDGVTMIEVTPVSPVRTFHLGLYGQQILTASGIEVESYHPGRRDSIGVPPNLLPMFLSLFPHISSMSGFGPMRTPRLTDADIETMAEI